MTIKTWRERIEDPRTVTGKEVYGAMQDEIDELHARLDAWEKQEPTCYGYRRSDGLILDVIHPDEHESYAGPYTVPLYTKPKEVL